MDELYEIFSSFSNIDWNLKCIIHILGELENAVLTRYDTEKIIGCCVYYFDHVEKELEDCIHKLDIYTLSRTDDMSDQNNKGKCMLNKFHVICQEILSLQPQDIIKLILEAQTEDEKELFELIGNFLIQKNI